MRLSIVATLYMSEMHLEEFVSRCRAAAEEFAGDDYEIVLVNDGSPDGSLDLAVRLAELHDQLCVVDLARNFGHHRAMMIGLSHAGGDFVLLIDSDLEEDPSWLAAFEKVREERDCDVVFGVQESRKGGWFERWSGAVFYAIFQKLIGFPFPKNAVTARLMTRRFVEALLEHREREVSIGGLFVITGFDQQAVTVRKQSLSESTYDLRRKFAVLVNSVTSFSQKPLEFIFWIGGVIVLVASIYIAYLLLNKLLFGTPLTGWTSVMASIWFLGGLIVSFIGLVGIYLSKIFIEIKQRPYAIVRRVYGREVAEERAPEGEISHA